MKIVIYDLVSPLSYGTQLVIEGGKAQKVCGIKVSEVINVEIQSSG
jgi:hypothetical protein